jgi:hypothetical protein
VPSSRSGAAHIQPLDCIGLLTPLCRWQAVGCCQNGSWLDTPRPRGALKFYLSHKSRGKKARCLDLLNDYHLGNLPTQKHPMKLDETLKR